MSELERDYDWVLRQTSEGINFVRSLGRSPVKVVIGTDSAHVLLHRLWTVGMSPAIVSQGMLCGLPIEIDDTSDWRVSVE